MDLIRTYHLRSILLFFASLVIFCSSCEKPNGHSFQYLHLSHTRLYEPGNLMDSLAAAIPFDKFDMLWLGGDLVAHSTQNSQTLRYLDSLLNPRSPDVFWSYGNHDYEYHPEWLPGLTGKANYYGIKKNALAIFVADTQDSLCNFGSGQMSAFNKFCGSLDSVSHFILLHHRMIWMVGNPEKNALADSVSNGGRCPDCVYGINPNNFYSDIYPELLKIKERGTEIILIGGDIGAQVKKFEYRDDNGIQFLASGIRSGEKGNLGLVFQHDPFKRTLKWKFVPLEKLIEMSF